MARESCRGRSARRPSRMNSQSAAPKEMQRHRRKRGKRQLTSKDDARRSLGGRDGLTFGSRSSDGHGVGMKLQVVLKKSNKSEGLCDSQKRNRRVPIIAN